MGLDVASGHAFCVHGEDFFFHVLCHGILILFDNLRFIFTVAVTGNGDLHIPIAGMHGFLGMSVPAVIRIFVPVIVLGITEFFVQFFIQNTFQKD